MIYDAVSAPDIMLSDFGIHFVEEEHAWKTGSLSLYKNSATAFKPQSAGFGHSQTLVLSSPF